MEAMKTFLVVFLLFTITTTYAINCYGGSIVQTRVSGGVNDDEFLDIVSNDNELFAIGYTYSSDFPVDLGYMVSGMYPAEALLTIASSTNATEDVFSAILSSYGDDYSTGVDIDGDTLCIAGSTTSPYSTPYNTNFATYSYSNSVFLWAMNISASPPYALVYETLGDSYDIDRYNVLVACAAKHNLSFLVSTSGYGAALKGYNDYDVRVTPVDLTDGAPLADWYFGGSSDEYVAGTDFFQRGNDKYLMMVGYTYSSGVEDSFPIANAYQSTSNGGRDAFVWVANVNNVTSFTWQFATFFGGSNYEDIYDATFDESGNVYVLGISTSEDLPLKNAYDPNNCGNVEVGCVFLAVFNLQGELLMCTWMGVYQAGTPSIAVSRLSDGGHLVYLTGYTYSTIQSMEGYQYNITNTSTNYQDIYVRVVYFNAQFTTGQVRLMSSFGGSDYEYSTGITVLPNNQFAISGYTSSYDLPQAGNYSDLQGYNAFTTIFSCGSGLYAVNPSPTPAASGPAPSPPPKTCETTDGCYSLSDTTVQFTTGGDGEYTPSQTIFAGTGGNVEKKVFLAVNYLTVEERDIGGNLIVSVPFPTSGYTLTSETQLMGNVSVDVVTFTNYLLNGAQVDVINYFFEEAGALTFAGTTVPVAAGTSKVSLRITGWNFEDTANSITLTVLLDISPAPKGPATSNTTGNQTQFKWDTGASDCIVTTVSLIEIDDTVMTTATTVSSTTLKVTFPYFADYVLYDPGYSVLVKDEKSSSPKEEVSPWAYVGAAIGAVVVVGAIVAVGYVLVSRQRRKTEKALSFRANDVDRDF